MLEAGVKILLAYLVGSVSGSLLLGRLRRVDIRTMGSGNAGGTNALRTQGLWFALGVVVIDVGKGAIAAGWLPHLLNPGSIAVVVSCGFASVFGHCFPIWHGFRGGKGAATALGTLLAVSPWMVLAMLGAWVLTLLVSGYVGLSTVLSGFSLAPAAVWLGEPQTVVIYGLVLGLFMAFTHRSNFRNMLNGTEHRSERFRLTRLLGRRSDKGGSSH